MGQGMWEGTWSFHALFELLTFLEHPSSLLNAVLLGF